MKLEVKIIAENIVKCCDKITELQGYISNAQKALQMWKLTLDYFDNIRHNESNIRRYESMIMFQENQIKELIKQLHDNR